MGILRPYVADVLAGTPWLDDHIYYHRKSRRPAERVLAVAAELRRRKFDLIVLLPNSLCAAAMAWWSRAPNGLATCAMAAARC